MQIVTLQNQFTIDRSIPTAFNIIQPVTGSWTSNRQPLVSWSASSDAVSGLSCYKLEINGDQVGDNIAPTATSTTVQTMLPDGGYSIRVAAHDNAQAPNIRWSGTGPVLLNIDGTAPTSAITSPSTGFVVYGNSVTVSGNASDGIGANLGIGVKYVLLSKNGGAVWDTVYVATAQTQGTVTWNKTYTALTPGNYTIAVKAIDWLNNMELSTASILIYVQATAPLADFTANPVNGVAPLSVSFTDASTPGIWPIASREWNFGDNSPVSTLQNPSHVYASRGVYTVSLTVRDAYNTSNSRTYTNMITVTNQAPTVILPLPDLTRDEDFAPIVINLNNYFSDGDGDVLLYTVTVTPAQVSATITSNTLTILPVLNYYGSVSVAVTANDQYQPPALVRSPRTKTRALVTDTFVLQINPVNDAPVINLPATFTFAEDGDLVINLASYVSDVDNANLTVTAQNSAHVTVVLNGLSATLTALANWNGTESVSFTVSDGTLNTTDQTNVDVTPVNDAPTFDLPLAFTFAEDGSMLVNMALYAHDVDDDILSLTASGNTNVTVVITDMNVTLSAAPDWNGTEQVTFTINDNMGRSIVSAVTDIIVTPVNDPPSIDGYSPLQSNVSVALNETLSFSITASDIDSPVNYSWFVNDVNQDNATNAFTYQFTQFATYFVKVIVSDSLTTVEQMWTVSVPVSTDNEIMTPLVTGLQSNYPNPFNPQTTIRYSVKTSGLVDLSVYDIKGQLIKDLKYGVEQPGTYNLIWDGRNNANRAVSSGMYYIRMKTDQGIDVLKITLTK
jgi:PKD repeat protein